MRRSALTNMMTHAFTARLWPRLLCCWFVLGLGAASAADTAAGRSVPGDKDVIASTQPMQIEAEDAGAHGQLVVDPQVVTPDTRTDLIYTISAEPLHGRVGLAGAGEEADFFKNKTSRLGYFAYRPEEGYTGEDSFSYTVRNETSGLVFQNKVLITVKPPPAIVLQKFEVGASRERLMNVRGVTLTTRPNTPVTQKIPSHEDFISASDAERHGQARSRDRPAHLRAESGFHRRGSVQVLHDRREQRAPRRRECHFRAGRAAPYDEAHGG
jgi:hypothetical protein